MEKHLWKKRKVRPESHELWNVCEACDTWHAGYWKTWDAVRDSECVGSTKKPDVPELPEVPPVMAVPSWDNYPPEFPTPKSLGQWISMLVRKVNAITDYLRAKEADVPFWKGNPPAAPGGFYDYLDSRIAFVMEQEWKRRQHNAELIPDVPEKMPPQSGMAYRLIDDRYNELREVVAALKRRVEGAGT